MTHRPFSSSALLVLVALIPAALPEVARTPQDDELEHILRLDGAEAGAATIEDFAWMEGSWRAEALGGICEETWSRPAAGAMMGMFRLLKGDTVSFYEFCTLREHEGTVSYGVKHFHADLKGWEEKDERVLFPLVEVDADGAWFDGATIQRAGADRFVQYVAIRQGGALREIRFDFHRVKAAGEAAESADR